MKQQLNVIGPQVRRIRNARRWTQPLLAEKLQLLGWNISVGSLGKLEAQIRRVPDCELMFLARALGVSVVELFPKNASLKRLGPQFQTGSRRPLFPTRADK